MTHCVYYCLQFMDYFPLGYCVQVDQEILGVLLENGKGAEHILVIKQLLKRHFRRGVPAMALEFVENTFFTVGRAIHIQLRRRKKIIVNFPFILPCLWNR
jgi:hypothetical protein